MRIMTLNLSNHAYTVGDYIAVKEPGGALMRGTVTSVSGSSVSFTVDEWSGATGAYSSWNVSLTGKTGATGPTGPSSGVTSLAGGTGITASGATGAVTITNTGVTSITGGTGVTTSGASGAVALSIGQSVATTATPTFGSITASGSGNTSMKINSNGGYAIQYFSINGTNKWHYEVTSSGGSWGLVQSDVAQRITVTPTETTFNNTPRYVNAPNVYGWHSGNEQIGTQMVIGAFAQSGYSFNVSNAWHTIGQVNITVPVGCTVIMMTYGFTMYTGSSGGFLVRFQYANGGSTVNSDHQFFKNEAFSHFTTAGVRGLGVTGGTSGLAWLQVYGQSIGLIGDANDSAYFTVHTV
jgi:hypothetical protein